MARYLSNIIEGWLPAFDTEACGPRRLGLYVNIPFSSNPHDRFDASFYRASNSVSNFSEKFFTAALEEINFAGRVLTAAPLSTIELDSIYIRAGAPRLYEANYLRVLIDRARKVFGIRNHAEVTIEFEPGGLNLEDLRDLKRAGVTRVVIDALSADSAVLRTAKRPYEFADVVGVAEEVSSAGLGLSIDLVFGVPGQTLESWKSTIESAVSIGPEHISIYEHINEPDVSADGELSGADLAPPQSDLRAEMYASADCQLSDAGFDWYEICHWAKSENSQSRHNISYWTSENWWGIGPGAHSHFGGVRWWNVTNVEEYSFLISEGRSPEKEREILDPKASKIERVMLGIRLRRGLDVDDVDENKYESLRKWAEKGLILKTELGHGKVVLTLEGRLLADFLARELS